jgi:BMFP domain-containing protein YqiC
MSDFDDRMEEILGKLKTERDELRVQLHLLAAEAKDEWEEVEKHWEHLESRMKRVGDAASDAGDDVAAAGKQLAEEIGGAYQRIRKSME